MSKEKFLISYDNHQKERRFVKPKCIQFKGSKKSFLFDKSGFSTNIHQMKIR